MKRITAILCCLLLIVMYIPMTALAASGTTSLSGPSAPKTGDTITVKLTMNGNDLHGLNSPLTYQGLQYKGGSSPKGWGYTDPTGNGSTFVLEDTSTNNAITGSGLVLNLTFTVTAGAGANISVTVGSGMSTDSNFANAPVSGSSYSATVAATQTGTTSTGTTSSKPSGTTSSKPNTSSTSKSNNSFLKALSAEGVTLSPAFDKNTTSYTASVPFSISKLTVTATTEDSKAKATVNSPDLAAAGDTDVTVTVKAEDGSTKTYTIKVTRAQDPNYKPGGNNNLSALAVDVGILSPAFSKDVTRYVVWLPYEVDKINVTGTAEDKKAKAEVQGGPALEAGKDNTINVLCTAENGDKKTYTVIAKRAAVSGNVEGSTFDTAPIVQKLQQANVKGSDPVVLDLTGLTSQQIDPAIFEALKAAPEATLEIDLGKMKITLKGSDIKNDIGTGGYDFTFKQGSDYKDKMTQAAQDENAFTYAFSYHGKLPGYAEFTLMTNYKEGEVINVYRYNPDSDSYDLIAKNVKVEAGGMIRYLNDSCSDYFATKNTVAGAKEYDSVKMQGSLQQSGQNNGGIPVLIFVLCLVAVCGLGFGAGIFISTLHARKQRYTESFRPHVTYVDDNPDVTYIEENPNEPYDTFYSEDAYTAPSENQNIAPTADKLFASPEFQDLQGFDQTEDEDSYKPRT